jgi:hypothetical protein
MEAEEAVTRAAVLAVVAQREASPAAEQRGVSPAEATPLRRMGADPARLAELTVEDTEATAGTGEATAGIVAVTTAEAVSTLVSVLAATADIPITAGIPITRTPPDMATIKAITILAITPRLLPRLRLAPSRINTVTAIPLSRDIRSNSRTRSNNSRTRSSRRIRSSNRTTAADITALQTSGKSPWGRLSICGRLAIGL